LGGKADLFPRTGSILACNALLLIGAMLVTLAITAVDAPIARAESASEAARDQFISRFGRLRNIEARFTLDVNRTPPPEFQGPFKVRGQTHVLRPTHTSFEGEFNFLADRAEFQLRPSVEYAKSARAEGKDASSIIQIRTPQRVETLVRHMAIPTPVGTVSDQVDFRSDTFIEIALGLRAVANGIAVECHDGNQTTLILNDTGEQVHRWLVDSSADGLQVKSYSVSSSQSDCEFIKFSFAEFQRVNGIQLPKKVLIERTLSRQVPGVSGQQPYVVETVTLAVQQYRLDAKDNVVERYQMVWPKGSVVGDTRIGKTFKIASGDRMLTDKDLDEIVNKKRDTTPTPSARP